ncbi:MAG: 2Fe-2S iron-sulfur cluster binding domain-containing protein [Hahellaceae bacterium]|nr:2Fe-2S iron-sulfur cluster binding domain-containing protein [Hahellaceae bacterium]MCP5168134.1 2Fe-2S iron-sulfur cluster binding domain-containing protein [Hahellaceae bacterium]
MAKLFYNADQLDSTGDVSVLDTLHSAGFLIPSSCRAGLCHACLLRADEGDIPALAQKGLSETEKRQRLFLGCQCFPVTDMKISTPDASRTVQARLLELSMLTQDVMRLRLKADVDWFPGQYTTLWKDASLGRSYSIASHPVRDGFMELHIKRYPDGMLSRWLAEQVHVGHELEISLPRGSCFYTETSSHQPLLLACTGTGLAPLYGVVQDALGQGHQRPIHLFAAAGTPDQLYLVHELRLLEQTYSNFHYYPVCRRNAQPNMQEGDLVELISNRYKDLKGWKVFLCGSPMAVKKLQKKCFLQGASMSDIHADAFESPLARSA